MYNSVLRQLSVYTNRYIKKDVYFPFHVSLTMSTANMNPKIESRSASAPAEESIGGATSLKEAKQKYEYFWKIHSPYSQWYPVNFKVDGQEYNCAEQYMMYQKAVLFDDKEIATEVLKSEDPKEQKSLGRKVKNWDDEKWNKNCHRIVEEANEAKFGQNGHLKKQLFATHPKTLVEASPVDTIWGIGYAEDHINAWDERSWRGTNYLGHALTRVREKLMKKEGLI
ncbi:N-glycosidase Npun_R5314-like [Haliotis rufescens]|uniref:N-glycosidase Npun_R5314-like n=1 Tax=Haliotis rufescens TaxID=6454 RepID=UPI001EAFB726|nr:N-glycosidase Npun_R5314-like [Haliotis rufescens]